MMDRTKGIGGSDIAAVLGVSPYKSALDVYLEKIGEHGGEIEPSDAMHWGTLLEPAIADEYERRHPEVRLNRMFTVEVAATDRPYFRCHPDALASAEEREWVVEIKTAGLRQAHRWGEDGETDPVPDEYQCQARWNAMICDTPRADIAVLLGGQEYREYTLDRDEEFETYMVSVGERFWHENVLARRPPAPDASESAKKALARLYPRDRLELLPVGVDDLAVVECLRAAKVARKKADILCTGAENDIKAIIGEHAGLLLPGKSRITWKACKDSTKTDYEAVVRDIRGDLDAILCKCLDQTIANHTKLVPGVRRLVVPRAWTKDIKGAE